MPLLPSDFALPALPYLLGLLVAGAATVALLYRRRPAVTEETVTALAPWMAGGGALYAIYQAEAVPTSVRPLFSSPAVYLTTGVLAGIVLVLVADRPPEGWRPTTTPGFVAITGVLVLLSAATAGYLNAVDRGIEIKVGITFGILLGTLLSVAVVWVLLTRFRPGAIEASGSVGLLAVFGHALDGVSTAVGYDLLGFGEQTPLSRIIIEAGGALPTAELLGAGWLFVLVKLVLAAVVVAAFEEYIREEPTEGYLFLGLIAAVGLGPGAHNVVLFAIA
ncbi:DUF63 family protein [Natronomonas amylolytica]|uniref:DUF63 family protein n=1 Tax=Natronomonas amylolytica TaxID=3108498 RepID=UPI00300B434D